MASVAFMVEVDLSKTHWNKIRQLCANMSNHPSDSKMALRQLRDDSLTKWWWPPLWLCKTCLCIIFNLCVHRCTTFNCSDCVSWWGWCVLFSTSSTTAFCFETHVVAPSCFMPRFLKIQVISWAKQWETRGRCSRQLVPRRDCLARPVQETISTGIIFFFPRTPAAILFRVYGRFWVRRRHSWARAPWLIKLMNAASACSCPKMQILLAEFHI